MDRSSNCFEIDFFIVTSLIAIVGPLLVFAFTQNRGAHLLVSILSVLVLLLGFRVATHSDPTDNKIRLTVISSSTTIFLAVLHLKEQLFSGLLMRSITYLNQSLTTELPTDLLALDISTDVVSGLVLACVVALSYFVLRSLAGSPPMGIPDTKIVDVLPPVTNLERLDILKQTLRDALDQLDHSTRWHQANYVPLQAEVQVLEGKSSRRRVVDLIAALRTNQSTRIFVVLGDPGSGKSVALRKLGRDLLLKSNRSDRIPIYINLKEWRCDHTWTPDSPPTVEEFHVFVLNTILQMLDFNSQSFLQADDNFRRLLEAGYFFFIFDSFDEIPAVLDHEENSWLIEKLSNCIVTYALGGRNARAIVASRLFRKPKILHHQRSVFELRPFSDDRIVLAINRASNQADELKRIVLTERPDLGSVARNPFLLNLIITHFNVHHRAPSSQAEMFDTFFKTNIALARSTFGLRNISDDEVYRLCEDISNLMFTRPNVGLEIMDYEVLEELVGSNVQLVLRFLTQARIGRLGGVSGAFSFAHRRFNEYFLVRRLLSHRTPVPLDNIQNDSRWRDALVLYAEIASEERALELARHAWDFARTLENVSLGSQRSEFIQARHALRFLIDGFRNRPFLLGEIHVDLSQIISSKLEEKTDYIEKKTLVEALGLLPIERSQPLILIALRRYPGWISEHAAAAARYFSKVDENLATAMVDYCTQRPGFDGLREARRQEPIFAISDGFSTVAKQLRWFLWSFYESIFCVGALCFVALLTSNPAGPLVFCTSMLSIYFGVILIRAFINTRRNMHGRIAQRRATHEIELEIPIVFVVLINGIYELLYSGWHIYPRAAFLLSVLLFQVMTMPSAEHDLSMKITLGIIIGACIPISPMFWTEVIRDIRKSTLKEACIFVAGGAGLGGAAYRRDIIVENVI